MYSVVVYLLYTIINGVGKSMDIFIRDEMRSSEWLERLTVNAVVATVLFSIPASSDTVESEGRQMNQC